MNRQKILIIAAAVLVFGNVGYRIWASWGLITVRATNAPLSTVLRTIEKQGGVEIRTNLEPSTAITMHVEKVPLAYALEVLAGVADARWQLGYFLAPTKAPITNALAAVTAGEKIEGWKSWQVDLPPGASPADESGSDPRIDRWQVKPAAEATLQAYLEQAAVNVSARFQAPDDWNPAISAAPTSGRIADVMPKLAKAAGGSVEQVFLLLGRPRSVAGAGPDGNRDGPPPFIAGFFGRGDASEADREKRGAQMEQRMQAEIDKMAAADRPKAQAEFDENRRFFQSLRDLPPDQRAAKMEERMSDPAMQERISQGMAKRDAMKTPQQRADRYRSYLEHRASSRN